MAVYKVVLMIAVALVIVAYAQEAVDEDLELAETKGKKHTRHIQPNNRPSPQRFRPLIPAGGLKGRGRSDSSENGGSNGGDEYDANNDGYIIISYGGRLGKGKKGQRYGNKYGSDYSVEYVGNVYGYEDDHGSQHGGFYDDGYNTEQDHFKGSSGAGDGNGESTGSKGNSESTGGSAADGGVVGGSDVTSSKGQGSTGNSGSISELAVADGGSKGNSGTTSDAAVTSSGDAMGGKGSKGESMVGSTLSGGDAMREEGTMGETGSKGTGESMGEGPTDAGTVSEMGDMKEGEMGEMGDVKKGEMGDTESEMEVSKGESMGEVETDVGDAPGDEELKGVDGSMANGEGAGGDDEKSNSGKSSSEMVNTGTKDSVEVGGSAEDSEYILEVVLSEDDELEEDASNKGSVLDETITKDSPAMAGKTSSVTMEKEKVTEGSTSGSAATVISSAMSGKEMSLAIDEMLKMAQMIKIDEMIKNGEMSKVDEMLKNAEMMKPEVTKEIMSSVTNMEKEIKETLSSVTMEKENKETMSSVAMETNKETTSSVAMETTETKTSGDGASSSTAGSMGQRRIGRNGSGTPRPGQPASGDRRSITAGKVTPVTSTNRVQQAKGSVSSKTTRSSSGSSPKPSNLPVNVRNAGSPRSKPDNNQRKLIPPRNNSEVNGNGNRRPSGINTGKVSSVPVNSAKKLNVTLVPTSKPVRSSIASVDKEPKILPGNGEKVTSGGKSPIRSNEPIISSVQNGTIVTSTSSVDGERRFLNMGNWRKQEKGAASGKSARSPSGASSGTRGKPGPGNGEKVINRGIKAIQSKPAQLMKPPSKLKANPMMGDTRPTFFTESRLKGETTTEKSIRTELGGRPSKNSVKEKRGIPSSAPDNSKAVSNTSAGNKGEKGGRGSDRSKGNGKKEIVSSSTTESPVTGDDGNAGSVTGEKHNSGFVRNASPLSIVRYLRKGIGRYL
ncbi:mucin-19-like isoform X4 [Daphnia pulicaria]|uniref:mucin-19-like isoform X4 n=1 Tax=Daphnia pulicaria TaxID=35523 RepID=UPI001EEC0A2F|nr:mucin-19-like isoform X4 [Daphnia pulicaria]